jgi:hypothetical protein
MATYVVSCIDYWGGAPLIKIKYAGPERNEAIKVFEPLFRDYTWNPDKERWFMLPPDIKKTLGPNPEFDKVLTYLVRQMDETGKVEIDSDWDDGEGDYPLYLQFYKENN